MIHLCYLTKPHDNNDLLFRSIVREIVPLLTPQNNLILFHNHEQNDLFTRYALTSECGEHIFYNSPTKVFFDHDTITSLEQLDLERISSSKFKNIILFNFDLANQDKLSELIKLKSKKSEFIGVSINRANLPVKKLMRKIQNYYNVGYTKDQISVLLVLKDDTPPDIADLCMKSYKKLSSSTSIKDIESINSIIPFLKE